MFVLLFESGGLQSSGLTPFNANPETLDRLLEDVPNIGSVRVARSERARPAHGFFAWDVVFETNHGDVPTLIPSFLIPQEAVHVVTVVFGQRRRQEIQRVTVAADNAAFAGQFRLVHGGASTVSFRFDVAVEELEKGLRALPGVAIEHVSLEATRHHGSSWLITFAEAAGSLQTLQAPSVFSPGSGWVTVEEVEDGEHAVGGVFALLFLGLGTTVPVAFDASAGTLEEVLRDMSGLDVTVDLTDLSDRREVTFRPVGPVDVLRTQCWSGKDKLLEFNWAVEVKIEGELVIP